MSKELWSYVMGDEYVFANGRPRYIVSSLGNVKQAAYTDEKGVWHDWRVLKQYVDGKQRHSVGLQRLSGGQRRVFVHMLVANAFIPNPTGATKVVHLDGNFDNNCVCNLKWVAPAPKPSREAPKSSRKRRLVRQYTTEGRFVAEYPSTVAAAKAVHISAGGQISQCCNRLAGHSTCAGYIWRYADDDEFDQ